MHIRFNITAKAFEDRSASDYIAYLERRCDRMEIEIERLKVAAAETEPPEAA